MSRSCIHCGAKDDTGQAILPCPRAEGHSFMSDNPWREAQRYVEAHGDEHPSALSRKMPIAEMQTRIHEQNKAMGWWDNPREDGTLLMLIVSEVVEAMEGIRKDLMDDHLPHRKMAEVELADAMIRIMDYAASKGYDVATAIVEKVEYNRTRADHQPGARAETHGKKF